MRVILPDDPEMLSDLETTILRREGYELCTVQAPRQAVEEARRGGADLVVLDARDPQARPCLDSLRRAKGCGKVLPVGEESARDRVRAVVDALGGAIRQSERLLADLPASARAGTEVRRGRTKDLSAGGAFLRTPKPLPEGTRIRMRIGDRRRGVDLFGRVVRTVGDGGYRVPGMGVAFDPPDIEAARRLRGLLDEHRGGPSKQRIPFVQYPTGKS
jgi:hypothetical protein